MRVLKNHRVSAHGKCSFVSTTTPRTRGTYLRAFNSQWGRSYRSYTTTSHYVGRPKIHGGVDDTQNRVQISLSSSRRLPPPDADYDADDYRSAGGGTSVSSGPYAARSCPSSSHSHSSLSRPRSRSRLYIFSRSHFRLCRALGQDHSTLGGSFWSASNSVWSSSIRGGSDQCTPKIRTLEYKVCKLYQ